MLRAVLLAASFFAAAQGDAITALEKEIEQEEAVAALVEKEIAKDKALLEKEAKKDSVPYFMKARTSSASAGSDGRIARRPSPRVACLTTLHRLSATCQ